jgi:hypothetical protein
MPVDDMFPDLLRNETHGYGNKDHDPFEQIFFPVFTVRCRMGMVDFHNSVISGQINKKRDTALKA